MKIRFFPLFETAYHFDCWYYDFLAGSGHWLTTKNVRKKLTTFSLFISARTYVNGIVQPLVD